MSDPLILKFGGQDLPFFLPMKWIVAIEREAGDKSVSTIYEELSQGIGLEKESRDPRYLGVGPVRIKDVFEVIRCAAIGGGMSPNDAATLVADYVDGQPYIETVPVAWAILNHMLMGVRLKKKASAESENLNHSDVEA
jgi:hypothetical protein